MKSFVLLSTLVAFALADSNGTEFVKGRGKDELRRPLKRLSFMNLYSVPARVHLRWRRYQR